MEQARSAIDLHMHSTASDGTDTIPELLQRKNNAALGGGGGAGAPGAGRECGGRGKRTQGGGGQGGGNCRFAAAERAEENDRIAQIVLVFLRKDVVK